MSMFAQDDWQPHEGLSVNGGVRWDHTDWSGLTSRRNDVAPRGGVAFDPWKTGTTAFRAAIGRYHDELLMPIARDGAIGFVQMTIKQPGYQGDPRTADPYGTNPRRPGSAQASFSVNRLAPTSTPYTDQLSVGVQHQLGSELGISIDLVRALGYRLLIEGDLNRADPATKLKPDPTLDQVLVTETIGRSWYTGLQIGVRKRQSHGYGFSVAYTWSTSENNTDGRSVLPVDPDDLMADRGPSANDARQRVTGTGTVELPLGCRFATVVSARSALPYNIITGGDGNNDGQNNDRPSGFSRNSARGSPAFQADVRVSKVWTFGKPRLELLVETFNVTNRPNWTAYNGTQGAASFGQPTTAGLPRQLQLGVRFDF
jgi:hypothetical protein